MILDALPRLGSYAPLHPLITPAAAWLDGTDLAGLPDGRCDIDGDRLYATVMTVDGKGQAKARLETHRDTIDIQLCLDGTDRIGWRDAAGLSPSPEGYQAEKDVALFDDPVASWIDTPPGSFVLFFPADAHAPLGATGPLRKIVVKLAAGQP